MTSTREAAMAIRTELRREHIHAHVRAHGYEIAVSVDAVEDVERAMRAAAPLRDVYALHVLGPERVRPACPVCGRACGWGEFACSRECEAALVAYLTDEAA